MKRIMFFCLLIVAVAQVISGCGGPGFSAVVVSPNSQLAGNVSLTITWPARTRLVPQLTNSIRAVLLSGSTTVASQLSVLPVAGSTSTVTFNNVTVGSLTLSATAYPNPDGSGTPLAAGSMPVTVVAAQTSSVTVTMASTIDHLELSPLSPSVEVNQAIALTPSAKNSAGALVLLSSAKLQWSSDNTADAKVSNNGVVTGVATGSANIRVTDTESNKTVSALVAVTPAPISWWKAEGNALDAEGVNNGTVSGGVSYTTGHLGQAFSFNGVDGVVNLGDPDSLKITGSLTIDAWVYVIAIPSSSQDWAKILFRGDDRDGLDPYFLAVHYDGNYVFQVCGPTITDTAALGTPVTLDKWQHVTGTLDNASGDMRLYVDGQLMGELTTYVRPFRDLDPSQIGGVGIGNHAGAPASRFHYPFNGYIDELKIYDAVVPQKP